MNKFFFIFSLILVGLVNAHAHPFSQQEYSLRTAITVSKQGVVPLVVLEIPIPIALKAIGASTSDPREVKKRKIKAYNEKQWTTLADNLIFTVDGKPVQGKWLAINHPANGKATEGFFVYMVSFNFVEPPNLQDGSTIVIDNQAYPNEQMVYSASVTVKEPWVLKSSTSSDILGEKENADLNDPERWTKDSALRTLSATITAQ